MWTPLKYTLWGSYGIKRILPKVGWNLRISGQGKTTLGKCQIADLATFLCKTWKLISASHRNSSSAGGSARVFKRRQCTAAKIYLNSPVCEFLLVLYFNCFEQNLEQISKTDKNHVLNKCFCFINFQFFQTKTLCWPKWEQCARKAEILEI